MTDDQTGVFVLEVDDDDLQELKEDGFLRFSFDGAIIEQDPIVDVEYTGET